MKKTILITGCNGYVASNLIEYLRNKYKIISIGRSNNQINIDNYNQVSESIKKSNIIIHLASIINPFDRDIFKINVDYTKFLVDKAKKYNKKFIYLSTQNVLFGKDNYSKSKKEAEKLVKILKNHVILRPTVIYGKNEKRYIGKLITFIKKSFFVPIIGNGKNKLQPIYIDDLIKIIEFCIDRNIKGTFLTPGGSVISYENLIDLIIKELKIKRIKFYLPILIIKPFAFLFQNLFKNPPITTIQLQNLKINKTYNIKKLQKIFNIKLKNINEGISTILK
jgi:NADH dehydrogenase